MLFRSTLNAVAWHVDSREEPWYLIDLRFSPGNPLRACMWRCVLNHICSSGRNKLREVGIADTLRVTQELSSSPQE